MNPDRAIAIILALSLVVVLMLGVWLLRRAHREDPTAPATPSATPSPPPTVASTPTPAMAAAARGYRLAGTVVGDLSYAIIEEPSGMNQLYRPGQTIPGLGEVTAIEADRVTLVSGDGTVVLQIAPAPITSPTAARTPSPAPVATPEATPARRPRRDQSTSESSP